MDLQLFRRVIWRFKWIVAAGLLLAVVASVLATARVSFSGGPHLTYRKPELWQSQTTLLITQRGFPWGRTFSSTAPVKNNASPPPGSGGITYLDAGGLANLSSLYARLASSDAVVSRLRLPPGEAVSAQPVLDATNHPLPIVGILGNAPTPAAAIDASVKGAKVFRRYIDGQQRAAGIPASQRVELELVNRVSPQVQLLVGHKKTLPIAAFLLVMVVTLGVVFALENARPELGLSATASVEREPHALQRTRSA